MSNVLSFIVVLFSFSGALAVEVASGAFEYQVEVEIGTEDSKMPLAAVCFQLDQDMMSASGRAYDFNLEIYGDRYRVNSILKSRAALGTNENPLSVPLAVACRSALDFLETYNSIQQGHSPSSIGRDDFINQPNLNAKLNATGFLLSTLTIYWEEVLKISNSLEEEEGNRRSGAGSLQHLRPSGFPLSDTSKYLIAREAGVMEAMAEFLLTFNDLSVFDIEKVKSPIYRKDNGEGEGYTYFSF